MRRAISWLALFSFPLAVTGGGRDKIALLKGIHVFVVDSAGANLRQLDDDNRKKGLLRWDAARNRLSYLADRADNELAHLVVMDLNGKILIEAAVPPITDPPESCCRFVEDLWWLPNGKLRVLASVNPMICVLFDQDVEAGTADNWHHGRCGGFVESPDGKHILERHPNYPAAEEERWEVLELEHRDLLDRRPPFYSGEVRGGVFFLAGPEWSPDSQKIAFIERGYRTGKVSLVILSLTGAVTRMPVTSAVAEHPAVAWVGDKVVAGEGADAVQVDSKTKYLGPVTYDVTEKLERSAKARRAGEAKAKRVEEAVRKVGGRDGVALQ